MQRARHRNAVTDEKFWFRVNNDTTDEPGTYQELTVNEIMNGKEVYEGFFLGP